MMAWHQCPNLNYLHVLKCIHFCRNFDRYKEEKNAGRKHIQYQSKGNCISLLECVLSFLQDSSKLLTKNKGARNKSVVLIKHS